MNELARKLIAVTRSHHFQTDYEEELKNVPNPVHHSWDEVARRFYRGYCQAIQVNPRPENLPPRFRIVKGGLDGE